MYTDSVFIDSDSDADESEVIELRTDGTLINPFFEKYNMPSHEPPVIKGVLPLKIRVVEPTKIQYSRQENKLFTLNQPLVFDPFNVEKIYYFYFLEVNGSLLRIGYDKHLNRFTGHANISIDAEAEEARANERALPWSIKFGSKNVAVVSDGFGRMLIVETGDRRVSNSWKILGNYHLLKNGTFIVSGSSSKPLQPFVILEVRTALDDTLSVLLGATIKQPNSSTGKRRENVHTFTTKLYWYQFAANYTPVITRIYEIKGNFESATMSADLSELIIVSSRKPKIIFSSVNSYYAPLPIDRFPAMYHWSQTHRKIAVEIDLKLTNEISICSNDLAIDFRPKSLTVKYKNEVVLDGELFDEINVAECKWELSNVIGMINLTITKVNPVRFRRLIPSDSRGRQIKHVEVVAPDNSANNSTNPEQLEDIDVPDDTNMHVTWNADKVSKSADLSSHQIVFMAQLHANEPVGIAFRSDVDAVFFTFTEHPPRHIFSIDALGYIQASKDNRRFTVCSPDGSYAAIVDHRNHAFIYAPTSTTSTSRSMLQNTRRRRSVNIPSQYIISLAPIDETYRSGDQSQNIIAATATAELLFIATDWAIFAIRVM